MQVKGRALVKVALCAYGMDARNNSSNPFQNLVIVQLRGAAAAPWTHAKCKVTKVLQCVPLQYQGANGRYFCCHKFCSKVVFFLYLRFAPAARAVKLGNYFTVVFKPNLVHTVFVGGERRHASVSA